MTTILYVTSSPRGNDSYSGRVAGRVLEDLKTAHPGAKVVVRDLARNPLPHIDDDFVAAIRSPQGPTTDRQRAAIQQSDVLIDELFAADIIVVATPMYNFGIPSTLKSWVDNFVRAGRTFSYSEKGPDGLLKGKKVILIQARGGVYSSGPGQAMNHQDPYLRTIFGFVGVTDIEAIEVEGIAFGDDAAEKAVAAGVARGRSLIGAAA